MTIHTKPALGQSSPRDIRENYVKPRLRFNWRCENCGSEWEGNLTEGYCCRMYAVDADEKRGAAE
jgi:hypothetical protein